MKVAIVGAGIGGLTAALALQADGHDVEVFEAAPEIRPLGKGINLLPHATEVLTQWGLLEALISQGVATRELAYFSHRGQLIWSEPRGLFGDFAAPQISLGRGVLHSTLLEAARARLGDRKITQDRRLLAFDGGGGSAKARMQSANGEGVLIEADLLVCADGIHSAARRQMYPGEGSPAQSGHMLWRATTLAPPFLGGDTMIMAGHEAQKFVCYPIEPPRADGLQQINWIAELRSTEGLEREGRNRPGRGEGFQLAFGDWRFDWLDIPALIKDAEQIHEFPMADRDPVASWNAGPVTLLGDAAHAMYPIGSNAASQAIVDARVLAKALREHADVARALVAYEAERLPATSAIVRANRQNGPEHCMQLAFERAPNGFARLEDVFAPGELQAIAERYRRLTGMKRTG